MIAKVVLFCAALASASSTLISPAVYGHGYLNDGYAIKAPVAPLLHAPLLTKPVIAAPLLTAPLLTKSYVAPGAVTVEHRSVLAHAAPHVAVAHTPLAYATVAKAPVAYTTTYSKKYAAPLLGHAGLLGAAPLSYGYAAPGLVYGSGIPHGHGLVYGPSLAYGPGLYGKNAYGKILL